MNKLECFPEGEKIEVKNGMKTANWDRAELGRLQAEPMALRAIRIAGPGTFAKAGM